MPENCKQIDFKPKKCQSKTCPELSFSLTSFFDSGVGCQSSLATNKNANKKNQTQNMPNQKLAPIFHFLYQVFSISVRVVKFLWRMPKSCKKRCLQTQNSKSIFLLPCKAKMDLTTHRSFLRKLANRPIRP